MKNNLIKQTKMEREIPMMPEEFKSGKTYQSIQGKGTTVPKEGLTSTRWTKEEEDWCWKLYKEGYSYKDIAESVGRKENSVSIKMKRLKKANGEYNKKRIEDICNVNDMYMEYMNNKYKEVTVLDVFDGLNKYYSTKGYKVIENNKNTSIKADYNMDGGKLLITLASKNEKMDIVDIDSFGACITYLEDALKIAEKGIILTFGELGHKRWKRLDFVSKHYNIKDLEDITLENLIENVLNKAKDMGKY